MVPSVATEKKSPATPLGIDLETLRLAAQCLNHYATPGLTIFIYCIIMPALLLVVFVFYAQIIMRKLALLTRRTSRPFLPDSHTMLIKLKDIRSHWGNRRVNKYVSCSHNPLFVCIVGTRRHACMHAVGLGRAKAGHTTCPECNVLLNSLRSQRALGHSPVPC
jgi:hypothetical protein